MTLFPFVPRWSAALLRGALAGFILCLALAFAGLATAAPRAFRQDATVTYRVAGANGVQVDGNITSNLVLVQLPPRPNALSFYTDSSYSRTSQTSALNQRLYIQATAEDCDRTDGIDEVTLHLYSATLKTTFDVTAWETAPHSGVFRTNAALTAMAGVVTTDDDMLRATLEGCGETVQTDLLVAPSGVVFDSQTGLPLAGATVTLIDINGVSNGGTAGSAARRLGSDGVSTGLNTSVTDKNGRYRLGVVQPGLYRLDVRPASGWTYPSQLTPNEIPGKHSVIEVVSYGKTFAVTGQENLQQDGLPDLPLDPLSRVLRVQVAVSRPSVEVAESVIYTVTLRNAGQAVLSNITLAGQLPVGFAYVPGSARQDGKPMADAALVAGPALRLAVGKLEPGASTTFSYRALVHAGATQGDGMHRVQARADLPLTTMSNTASVRTDVTQGVFTDKAMVLGTVFADCNGNGVQDLGEPGAPGIRMVLEDGTFATTDAQGRYSFYGLRPRTHVVKIDTLSLPAGAEPVATSQRHAGDGHSRFIDPRPGQLVRADFALAGCSPELAQTLKDRAARLRGDRELELSTRTQLSADGATRGVGDLRALQASGVIGANGVAGASAANGSNGAGNASKLQTNGAAVLSAAPTALPLPTPATAPAPTPATTPASTPAAPLAAPLASTSAAAAAADAATETPADDSDASLEQLAATLDNKLGFLDVKDGQRLAGRLLLLRTKSRAGAQLTLEVNGTPVGDDRVGQKVVNSASQTELREYVGVALRAGDNTLTLTERDGFGNVRNTHSVAVMAPGELAQIRVTVPATPGASDGESVTQVRLELLDRDGLRVTGRTAITLDSTLGQWEVRDLDALHPGTQTFVDDGLASFGLRAPTAAGDALVTATAGSMGNSGSLGNLKGEVHYRYAPALRPLLAVGLVEGVLNLRKLRPGQLLAAGPNDGFAAELQQNSLPDDRKANGEKNGTRTAVYLKGKVTGETLLTLAYESDKDRRERLFRDIQPDAFYPIYGDDSVKGFDAQSTSRLYVRLERGATAVLYGDFTTQSANPVRQLGAYQRSLTGARVTHNDERFTGSAFASRDTSRQLVIEQRGNGTSGPYDLGSSAVLVNSERVELLVRDRNQPSVVLRSTPQQRFADYDFEPLTGRLLMRAPVPSTDADLNPVSIRVTAEADQGGASFWVAGADGQIKLTDSIELGGSVVKDWNPLAPFQLVSANTKVKLAEHTTLVVEAAHTIRPEADANLPATGATGAAALTGSGDAQRIELQHDGATVKGRIYAARADANFSNASSTLSAGRTEAGAKGELRIDERTRLLGEALHSEDLTSGRQRDGALLGVERSFDGGMKAEAGVRHVSGTPDSATAATTAGSTSKEQSTALRAKFSSVLPWLPKTLNATGFVEAEQDTQDSRKHLAAVGGDMQLPGNTGRVYARHEFISSLTGPYSLDASQRRNTTLVGIDSAAPFDGRGFGEYRLRDGISGREAEAAMGLRNQWSLAQGLRLNTSVERVQALQGQAGNDAAAATAAVEYTSSPLLKSTARLEVRHAATGDSVLASLATAYKLNQDWTLLGRGIDQLNKGVGGAPDREQQRLQLGLAYRDTATNKVNGLARYELKRETGLGAVAAASTDIAAADGARTAHIVSSHGDYQWSRSLVFSGQVAAKVVTETIDGQRISSNARLLSGRVTKDIGDRWDVGLAASVMAGAGARNTAVGAEAGYRVQDNMWASLGYNFRGFKDRELSADNHTERGVFVRFRFKFDERSFK